MVGFPRGDGKVSLLRGEVECHGRIREKSMVEVGGSGMPCGPVGWVRSILRPGQIPLVGYLRVRGEQNKTAHPDVSDAAFFFGSDW